MTKGMSVMFDRQAGNEVLLRMGEKRIENVSYHALASWR
jgi:hypothetical protein